MDSIFDRIYEHSLVVVEENGREILWHQSVHGYGYAPLIHQPYLLRGQKLEYRVRQVRPSTTPPAEFAVSSHG